MKRNHIAMHPCVVIGTNLNAHLFTTIQWKASLWPGAAIIPAPTAYIKNRIAV